MGYIMFIRLGLFIATLVAFTGGSAATGDGDECRRVSQNRNVKLRDGLLWIQDERVSRR